MWKTVASGYAWLMRFLSVLRVFEVPAGEAGFLRCKARVRVVPQPEAPAGDDPQALRRQAAETLRALQPPSSPSCAATASPRHLSSATAPAPGAPASSTACWRG